MLSLSLFAPGATFYAQRLFRLVLQLPLDFLSQGIIKTFDQVRVLHISSQKLGLLDRQVVSERLQKVDAEGREMKKKRWRNSSSNNRNSNNNNNNNNKHSSVLIKHRSHLQRSDALRRGREIVSLQAAHLVRILHCAVDFLKHIIANVVFILAFAALLGAISVSGLSFLVFFRFGVTFGLGVLLGLGAFVLVCLGFCGPRLLIPR